MQKQKSENTIWRNKIIIRIRFQYDIVNLLDRKFSISDVMSSNEKMACDTEK